MMTAPDATQFVAHGGCITELPVIPTDDVFNEFSSSYI
jgi:hypothetical protein